MPLADPHCHTTASDGMVTPAELVAAAVTAGVDLIAVTDHDTMAAVTEVKEIGEAAGLEVVAGQEITTRWPAQTHMLAWFLDRPVRSGMSVEDTVKALDGGALESLLVLDAVLVLTSVVQARAFNDAIPMTGLVLAKLDGSARGGAAITVESELGVPVKLAGVGEGIDDIAVFDPPAFVRAMVGD